MAQDAIKNLMGNREAIRKLMAMDANGTMDQIVENAQSNGSLAIGENGLNYTPQQRQTVNEGQNRQINPNAHTKMPKKILESFQKNPGQNVSNMGNGASVLDGINFQPIQKSQKPLQEVTPNMGTNIDYSLIKTIINEAVQENVKKYVSAMTKKVLSEGKGGNLKAVKVSGEQISFITENGDIYTAKLEFKRNIKNIND